MPRYRKKPVVIEARQAVSYLDFKSITAWVLREGGVATHGQIDPGPAYMEIKTLEGVMRADVGDWIIRGVEGEFYPCKNEIFLKSYEQV